MSEDAAATRHFDGEYPGRVQQLPDAHGDICHVVDVRKDVPAEKELRGAVLLLDPARNGGREEVRQGLHPALSRQRRQITGRVNAERTHPEVAELRELFPGIAAHLDHESALAQVELLLAETGYIPHVISDRA